MCRPPNLFGLNCASSSRGNRIPSTYMLHNSEPRHADLTFILPRTLELLFKFSNCSLFKQVARITGTFGYQVTLLHLPYLHLYIVDLHYRVFFVSRSWEGWTVDGHAGFEMVIPEVSRVARGRVEGHTTDLVRMMFHQNRLTVE